MPSTTSGHCGPRGAVHSGGSPQPCGPAQPMLAAAAVLALPAMVVSPEHMLRVMGYRQSTAVRPRIRETAASIAALAGAVAAPAAVYRRLGIAGCSRDGLVLADGTRFTGPVFASLLAGCDEVALFVLSLGSRFDTTQQELTAAERTLEAYMLEVAGWLGIEAATKALRGHLAREARDDGLRLTRRMAPGYTFRIDGGKVDWPLEDQGALFAAFGEVGLPAQLLEQSCAMTPKMSRSGMYGLCPADAAGDADDDDSQQEDREKKQDG